MPHEPTPRQRPSPPTTVRQRGALLVVAGMISAIGGFGIGRATDGESVAVRTMESTTTLSAQSTTTNVVPTTTAASSVDATSVGVETTTLGSDATPTSVTDDDSAPTPTAKQAPPGTPEMGACAAAPVSVRAKASYVVMSGFGPGQLDAANALLTSPEPPAGIFINADITSAAGSRLAGFQARQATLIAIDEEGGRVQRIEKVAGHLQSAAELAALADAAVKDAGDLRGRHLLANGINLDFGPVVDLRSPSSESVIGDRSFGSDPTQVIAKAGAFAAGLRSAGVIPTIKHFPGHGHSNGDSHKGTTETPPLEKLQSSDLQPFSDLAKAPGTAVMMGHLTVPGLTLDGKPTSLSPEAYSLLRKDLGFDGLVVTDDLLGMAAVTNKYGAVQAGVLAISAGADLALFQTASQRTAVVDGIAAAVESGKLGVARLDDAVRHIRAALECS